MSNLQVAATFASGLVACLISGTIYGFGLYAPAVKALFGWSQTQINLVGSLGDVGVYAGVTMALLCDVTSARITMLVGAALQGLGYTLLALAVWGIIPVTGWPLMALFVFLVGQGSYATYTAGYNPSVFNLADKYRGRAMSAMVAAFAASSMIFSFVYKYGFRVPATDPRLRDHTGYFLMLLAIVTTAVAVLCSILAVRYPRKASDAGAPAPPETGETPLRLFLHLDFYLLTTAVLCIAGSGLLWINSQGNIAVSLRDAPAADTLVILVGASSVTGRLVTGFLSDWLAPKRVPRAVYLVPSATLMALSHLLFAFFQEAMLYPTAVCTGIAYGTMFSVTVTAMPLFFGKRWMATCNAVLAVFAAVGGVGLGLISGHLYGLHADADGNCFGLDCFRNSFIVSGCLSAFCIASDVLFASHGASAWLSYRTRANAPLYVPVPVDETRPLLLDQMDAKNVQDAPQ